MSNDQGDCERGQEALLSTGTESTSLEEQTSSAPLVVGRKKASVLACCGLGAVVFVAAATRLPSTQIQFPVPQEHRRLAQAERQLSLSARMQDFFNVVFVSSEPEDEIGFGKDFGEDFGIQAEEGAEEEEQCPGQNMGYKGLYMEVPRIWSPDLGAFGIDEVTKGESQRTFIVDPNHTVLEGGRGVMFNVEVVPAARPQDFNKTRLSQAQISASLRDEASEFYKITTAKARKGAYTDPAIEVMSEMPTSEEDGGGTVYASGQGFLAACMTAFAHHLPLALSPDDLWTVIANGFARHVDQHAEELRSNFVAHEGQKEIRIREDSMVKGGSPPAQWEALIFPKFAAGIAENVNNKEVLETLSGNFTTSTASSQAASSVVLMATMKNYFKFHMDTMCGIPNVRLDGTRDDWESLRERTKTLAQYMMQNSTHGDLWIYDIVLPILDEFIHSYDGEPNYCFWQNMVKFRTTGTGSGSFDFLSGWLQTLFPYLSSDGDSSRPNPYLKPWLQSASAHYLGPQPQEIPIQLSSVPVQWNYLGEEFPMHFHAGFRGVHQEADGTVRPIIGWYVTEDPEAER